MGRNQRVAVEAVVKVGNHPVLEHDFLLVHLPESVPYHGDVHRETFCHRLHLQKVNFWSHNFEAVVCVDQALAVVTDQVELQVRLHSQQEHEVCCKTLPILNVIWHPSLKVLS